jgi:protoporphyrinogen oxidase
LPFKVYEASGSTGGNCSTFDHEGFRYDSGAHRLHDKDAEVTNIFKELLGDEMLQVEAPSAIYYNGKLIDFPLSPLDLLVKLGPLKFVNAGMHLLKARLGNKAADNFMQYALHTYGKPIADMFLLHYTEKLWGRPAHQLATEVSGSRLKGLDLQTFLKEALAGKKSKTRHIDGQFYYPRQGIGQLFEILTKQLGTDNIHLNSRITRIIHDGKRLTAIEINDKELVEVDQVISSLPVTLMANLMDPAPPEDILQLCKSLHFRHLVLVAIMLNKPQITPHATLYFPSKEHVFTRITEPRNRSPLMAPEGMTSLVAEVPVDAAYSKDYESLPQRVIEQLTATGLIAANEVLGTQMHLLPFAYPILEIGYKEKLSAINHYFSGFENMQLCGRNAAFSYTHIHDHFRNAGALRLLR